jgi:phage shock protein A
MNDLFKKLNVLVKSSLNDLIGDEPSRRRAQPRLGKNIDREIAALRQRVNDAYTYEAELKSRIVVLGDEIARLDREADEAVEQRRDEQARYVIEQMQRTQQRLTMSEADLREHQLVTQELVQRVNTLETYVAEARRAQQEVPDSGAGGLAEALRQTREKLARDVASQPEAVSKGDVSDQRAVEDDLERRRQRLSKP